MNDNYKSAIDKLFFDVMNEEESVSGGNFSFAVDVFQTDNAYVLEAELAGYDASNIKLEYKEDYLLIEVKREREKHKDSKKIKYCRTERFYGVMSRAFYMPSIIREQIDANLDNGVLTIFLPKKLQH